MTRWIDDGTSAMDGADLDCPAKRHRAGASWEGNARDLELVRATEGGILLVITVPLARASGHFVTGLVRGDALELPGRSLITIFIGLALIVGLRGVFRFCPITRWPGPHLARRHLVWVAAPFLLATLPWIIRDVRLSEDRIPMLDVRAEAEVFAAEQRTIEEWRAWATEHDFDVRDPWVTVLPDGPAILAARRDHGRQRIGLDVVLLDGKLTVDVGFVGGWQE